MYTARQLEAPLRFGVTLAVAGILLKLLVLAMPAELSSPVAERLSSTAGQLAGEAFRSSLMLVGRGLLLALPVALLLALPALLWPHSWPGKLLRAMVSGLTGVPAMATVLLVLGVVAFEAKLIALEWGMLLTLTLLMAPWVARALVDSEGSPLVATGLVARQSGNLLLGALVAGLFTVPAVGGMQTLELAAFRQDLPLLFALLSMAIPAVALVHLVGDTLVAIGGDEPPSSTPGSPLIFMFGLVMAAGLLVAACLPGSEGMPLGPGARLSLAIGLVATLVALAGAVILGLLSRLGGALTEAALTPQGLTLSLMPPFLLGTAAVGLQGRSLLWMTVAIGVGSIPVLAGPAGRFLRAASPEERAPQWSALAGGVVLVLAQALLTEITLSTLSLGVPAGSSSLGTLMRSSISNTAVRSSLWAAAVIAVGLAGLTLVGTHLVERSAARLAPPESVPLDEAGNQ